MTNSIKLILFVGFIAVLTFIGSVFTINQTEQAIILQFGELRRSITTPGLKFKVPFIQDVIIYEKRVLDFDLPAVAITTGDQKRIFVDTYTRYKISDPAMFFRGIKPSTEKGAHMRLEAIVSSTVRNVLGKVTLRNLLSEDRSKIMRQINEEVEKLTKSQGIEIVDLRIIRTELPPENRQAVFNRMNSELQKIAKETRAKGDEKAQEIRSAADKERTVLLAEAQGDSFKIRGEGESKSLQIVSDTLGKDPEFYSFYRSMEIYKQTLTEGTTMFLSSDNELLRFFSHPERTNR